MVHPRISPYTADHTMFFFCRSVADPENWKDFFCVARNPIFVKEVQATTKRLLAHSGGDVRRLCNPLETRGKMGRYFRKIATTRVEQHPELLKNRCQ